jgi:hypothetical protein
VTPVEVWGAIKLAFGAGETAYKGWGLFRRWWYGSISVTHPQNRSPVELPTIHLEGTHSNPRGHFWLIDCPRTQECWPKQRITLHPGGHWREAIWVGEHPGPRTSVIQVVWVSEFMHEVLEEIMAISRAANTWRALKMKPPKTHFSVVQSVVLHVQNKPKE